MYARRATPLDRNWSHDVIDHAPADTLHCSKQFTEN